MADLARTGLYGKRPHELLRALLLLLNGNGSVNGVHWHRSVPSSNPASYFQVDPKYDPSGEVLLASAWHSRGADVTSLGKKTLASRVSDLLKLSKKKTGPLLLEWSEPWEDGSTTMESSAEELSLLRDFLQKKPPEKLMKKYGSALVDSLCGKPRDPVLAARAAMLIDQLEEAKKKHEEEVKKLEDERKAAMSRIEESYSEKIRSLSAEHYRAEREAVGEIGSL